MGADGVPTQGPVPRSAMAHHVDDDPIRVLDEEASDAPWLVGEGVDDTVPPPPRLGMDHIHVRHLDGVPGVTGDDASWFMRLRWTPSRSVPSVTIQPRSIATPSSARAR